jgi:hypothetical protein
MRATVPVLMSVYTAKGKTTSAKVNSGQNSKIFPLFCLSPVYTNAYDKPADCILYRQYGGKIFSRNVGNCKSHYNTLCFTAVPASEFTNEGSVVSAGFRV